MSLCAESVVTCWCCWLQVQLQPSLPVLGPAAARVQDRLACGCAGQGQRQAGGLHQRHTLNTAGDDGAVGIRDQGWDTFMYDYVVECFHC